MRRLPNARLKTKKLCFSESEIRRITNNPCNNHAIISLFNNRKYEMKIVEMKMFNIMNKDVLTQS